MQSEKAKQKKAAASKANKVGAGGADLLDLDTEA